jgi:hypothetical protein
MTTAKWTINSGQQQDLHYRAARFNEKGCSLVWDGDALTCHKYLVEFLTAVIHVGEEAPCVLLCEV